MRPAILGGGHGADRRHRADRPRIPRAGMTDGPKSDYDAYPRTLPRDDIWGQVRRTINGRRISEAEVQEIVAALRAALALACGDTLLDLACGNGALTARLF